MTLLTRKLIIRGLPDWWGDWLQKYDFSQRAGILSYGRDVTPDRAIMTVGNLADDSQRWVLIMERLPGGRNHTLLTFQFPDEDYYLGIWKKLKANLQGDSLIVQDKTAVPDQAGGDEITSVTGIEELNRQLTELKEAIEKQNYYNSGRSRVFVWPGEGVQQPENQVFFSNENTNLTAQAGGDGNTAVPAQAERAEVIREWFDAGRSDIQIAHKLALSESRVKQIRLGMGLKRRRGRKK